MVKIKREAEAAGQTETEDIACREEDRGRTR